MFKDVTWRSIGIKQAIYEGINLDQVLLEKEAENLFKKGEILKKEGKIEMEAIENGYRPGRWRN